MAYKLIYFLFKIFSVFMLKLVNTNHNFYSKKGTQFLDYYILQIKKLK